MKRHKRRRLISYATLYLSIILMLVGVVNLWPNVRALPVTGGGTDAREVAGDSVYERMFAMWPDLPREILRAGLPLLAFVEDSESELGQSFGADVSLFFTGINPEDPVSILKSQFPALASRASGTALLASIEPTMGTPATDVIFRLPGSSPRTPSPVVFPSDEPVVAIYHTHSKESYLPDLPNSKALEPEDAYADDPNVNMTRVGLEIARSLQEQGIPCVHSPAVHDKDGKLGAYLRSEVTVQTLAKQYPTLKVFLDVHRDSLLRSRTTALVRRQLMAKVMVVLGNDNKDWRKNYDFAAAFNNALEDKFPGLSTGIFPTAGRFNQHHSEYAILLEVGGVENNLEEALRSARAIAETVAHLVKTRAVK